ncbi:MAG: Hsp70 family protein [Deltaproteobacteria bacterium]|nr:Hsp70 family protein [Deltaproteobacteria bacterium]
MSYAIGIDLGTTNTVVAAVVDGVAVTLEDEQRRRLLPSVVSFHPSGTVLVGEAARERRLIDPENTVFSVKPLIGRPFDSDEVKAARSRLPFQFTEGAKNATMVMARDVAYAIPEISAFVLRRAKAIAEHALGAPVERAVITVPANFNDLQRASTKIAGKLAGLEVLRILNEPTAAALAYGQSIAKAEKIAVYDFGGGTFDITLLDLTGNVFEVLATAGDTALGGDDIDRVIADAMCIEVLKRFNYDPRTDPVAYGRLRFIAEEVKKELSVNRVVQRELSGIGYTAGGDPINMSLSITRDELDRIAAPLVDRTIAVARQSVEIIGLKPNAFDRVLLVGGSTRMPLVARQVEALFGQPPHLKVNPDEVVALGAAIQAHALNRTKGPAKRKSAHDQLAKTAQKVDVPKAPALPANLPAQPSTPAFIEFSKAPAVITFSPPPPPMAPSPALDAPEPPPQGAPKPAPARRGPPPIPSSGRKAIEGTPVRAELQSSSPLGPKPARSSAAPAAPNASVPPELDFGGSQHGRSGPDLGAILAESHEPEPVTPPVDHAAAFARGSAVETAASAPLLIDVTPLSLRVETVGGYSDVLISANSPVPCEKARTFLTASDNQTVVFIRVAQGESSKFAENTRLGELELSGLKPAPRGSVKVLVTFELDADGILNVRAKDKDTDRETKATMRLLGTSNDAQDIVEMAKRQAARVVA